MSDLTPFELEQRRAARQMKSFQAATAIKQRLGRVEVDHVHVAALNAVAESRAVMHALIAKGILTEREAQDHLDWGYDSVLAAIAGGMGAKVMEGGHG